MAAPTHRFLTPADHDAWQALWERSERSLFLHWRWTEAAATGSGTPVRLGLFDRSGRNLLAGVAFVERPHRFMTEWRHPAPAPFAGLLHEPGDRSESFLRDMFAAVARGVPSEVDLAEILLQPSILDARGLIWTGWEAAPHYNYVSRIDSAGALESAAESSVLRQAKKARLLESTPRLGLDQIPDILALWEETRRRHRLPAYVHPDFWGVLAGWIKRGSEASLGFEALTIRSPEDDIEAGALLGRDAHRVYYLLGASRPESLGTGAPTLLHFEAAAFARRAKWPPLYDWVGANTPSVAQFKKKFRPDLETLLRCTWKRPRRKLIEDAKSVLRGT